MQEIITFCRAALLICIASYGLTSANRTYAEDKTNPPEADPQTFTDSVTDLTGTFTHDFEMVLIDGKQIEDAALKPFYICNTEVTWDQFNIYLEQRDLPDKKRRFKNQFDFKPTDTRPSSLSHPPNDPNLGASDYPANSMTFRGARMYCDWLTAQSGGKYKYRLPTEKEWEIACGTGTPNGAALNPNNAAQQDSVAWTSAHAQQAQPESTQPVAQLAPNQNGIYDMLGNVAEWCVKDGTTQIDDQSGVLRGGHFKDNPNDVIPSRREFEPPPAANGRSPWHQTNPNIPTSRWWYSNAPFTGLRVVCEVQDPNAPTVTADQAEEAAE